MNEPIIIIAQTDEQLLDTTQVIIDPELQRDIQDVVKRIQREAPELLQDITHIYALHTQNFGEWHSDDPHAIFLNLKRIREEVKRQMSQGLSADQAQSDVVQQEIERATQEQIGKTMAHERAHVVHGPEGGEGPAEQAEKAFEFKSGLRNFTRRAQLEERERLREILTNLGYLINPNGAVFYASGPKRIRHRSIWEAIQHQKKVIENNTALIKQHAETADPLLLESKRELVALAKKRLNALTLWYRTYGKDYVLPGYQIRQADDTTYEVTKEADGTQYQVDVQQHSCTCPAGVLGKPCKHLKAVFWEL